MKKFSCKAIESWTAQYKCRGLEGLMPAARSDRGTSRELSGKAVQQIFRIKEDFPCINATQIHQKLIQDSFIPATVSVDSVQRFIRSNNLKSARNPNLRDRKAFEEDSFGKMWQADTCYIAHITRKVRNDATVSIFRESYDVPMQFIGMKVEIRFLPKDMNSAYILYEDTKSPVHKTNKIDNCHTKRSNQNPLDYSKIGGND